MIASTTSSDGKDCKNWWFKVAEELEVAAASCDNQRLFRPIRDTGKQRAPTGEIVCGRNREPIPDRLVEYFEEQFNWPYAPAVTTINPGNVPLVSRTEAKSKTRSSKRRNRPLPTKSSRFFASLLKKQ